MFILFPFFFFFITFYSNYWYIYKWCSLQINFPIFFPSTTSSSSSSSLNYSRTNRIRLSDPESSNLNSFSSTSSTSSESEDEDSRFPTSSRSPSSHLSRLRGGNGGGGGTGEDRSDELPDQFIPSKIDNLKDYLIRFSNGILAGGGGGGGMIKVGNDGTGRSGDVGRGNNSGRKEGKEAGIGSAFWGSRQGSIRLPTSSNFNSSNLNSGGSNRKQEQQKQTTLLERVPTSSPFQFTSSSSSSSSSQIYSQYQAKRFNNLFDLGEEGLEEEDELNNSAIELPREIKLEDEDRELPNWGSTTTSQNKGREASGDGFPSRGLR